MEIPLYGCMYELHARHHLNKKSQQQSVKGFLLKRDVGVGCVQPWECFGHASLQEHWHACKEGRETEYPILMQALACAKLDSESRHRGVSWWANRNVPESHATITDVDSQGEEALKRGFYTWKCKVDPASLNQIEMILRKYAEIRLRLDFNETGNVLILHEWLQSLSLSHRRRIEFIEDPVSYEEKLWNDLSHAWEIDLAVDRDYLQYSSHSMCLPIWKPAWSAQLSVSSAKMIVTSAMDHPVGQAWAAFCAAECKLTNLCGLRTDHLFEINAFSEVMGEWNPKWPMIPGMGMGFDQQLEKLAWTRLR